MQPASIILLRTGTVLALCATAHLSLFAATPTVESNTQEPARLVVAIKESPPFTVRDSAGNWSGLSVDLWKDLAQALDLPFDFVDRDLAGLLDDVASGDADVGIAALTVTPAREERMDFTHPYYRGGLGVAVRQSTESLFLSLLRNVFSVQFLSAVLALVAVLLAAAAAVWLFERKANPEQFGGGTAEGLGASFWWSAVTMTTVGYGDKAPQSLGGRVVAVIWMFTSVIIISSFTAGIASSVTVNRIATDLLRSRPLHQQTVATVADSTGHEYALKSGFRVIAYPDLDQALTATVDGKTDVLLYDLPILRHRLIADPTLGLEVLPQTIVPEEYAVALRPDSPFREALNVEILKVTRTPQWQERERAYFGQ